MHTRYSTGGKCKNCVLTSAEGEKVVLPTVITSRCWYQRGGRLSRLEEGVVFKIDVREKVAQG
jgi:hypothetical protein